MRTSEDTANRSFIVAKKSPTLHRLSYVKVRLGLQYKPHLFQIPVGPFCRGKFLTCTVYAQTQF